MSNWQCLYDYLKREGYSPYQVSKMTNMYFKGQMEKLPLYMQKSIYYWECLRDLSRRKEE